MFKRFDVFSKEIPAFSIKGERRISTTFGGITSVLIYFITVMYSALKMVHLTQKHNPNISELYELDYYDQEEKLNLSEIDFKLAFTIEGFLDELRKDDPRYVKYTVRTYGKRDGIKYEKIIPYHKCTEEDWALFAPPDKSSFDTIQLIKENPERGMFCFDYGEDYQIYGNERNQNYQRVEVIFSPCNYVHTESGYEDDSVQPECIPELDKQIEYLGSINILLYYSQDILLARNYGETSFNRFSTLTNIQVSEKTPNWVNTLL